MFIGISPFKGLLGALKQLGYPSQAYHPFPYEYVCLNENYTKIHVSLYLIDCDCSNQESRYSPRILLKSWDWNPQACSGEVFGILGGDRTDRTYGCFQK